MILFCNLAVKQGYQYTRVKCSSSNIWIIMCCYRNIGTTILFDIGHSDVQAENFYLQVKFINCLERLSVLLKNDIRDWDQSNCPATGMQSGGEVSWNFISACRGLLVKMLITLPRMVYFDQMLHTYTL